MTSKNVLERQVESWRGLSLALLLLMGIVGAISYSIIMKQKAVIIDKEITAMQIRSSASNR